MRALKAVQLRYSASEELDSLFEDFRLMCNDAIRIALEFEKKHYGEKVKNRFALITLAYPRLKEYGLHSQYILSACEVAYSVYRNKYRKSLPFVKRPFLKLYNKSYSLDHLILRIPTKPRQFIYITLQASDHHLSMISNLSLKIGSITIDRKNLSISISKDIAEVEPLGNIGIDVNEKNVTTSTTTGVTHAFDTSNLVEVKELYRAIRAKIGQRTRSDNRISQKLQAKYGTRVKNRTVQRLHVVSKAIVEEAKINRLGIVMENLKGIRRLYRKGNWQGSSFSDGENPSGFSR